MDLVEELEQKYGRSLTAKELAQLLRVNPRTVNQYAHFWGGIRVTPKHYRFFEKLVVEVIENANHRKQEGQETLFREGDGTKKPLLQTFPRRPVAIKKSRYSVGNRHPRGRGKGVDGHGLFIPDSMDE